MSFSTFLGCILFYVATTSSYVFATSAATSTLSHEENTPDKVLEKSKQETTSPQPDLSKETVVVKKTAQEIYEEQLEQRIESKRKIAERFNVSLDELLLLDNSGQKKYAWSGFYKKPSKCEDFESDLDMINCSNFYARKKKQFEKIWKSI